jgi:hypothetical protein
MAFRPHAEYGTRPEQETSDLLWRNVAETPKFISLQVPV